MKKKMLVVIIPIAIVVLAILCAIGFYSRPFSKLNDAIIYMNKGNEINNEENSWISYDDLIRLKVVNHVNDGEYVEIKTKKHIEHISLCNVSIKCDIDVSVKDWDTWNEIENYHQTIIVRFSFSHFQWIVESVE